MPAPVINEFVASHAGADDSEFIEIFGDPGTDLSAYSLLQVEGDLSGTATGTVDSVITVGTTDASGFWTTGFLSNSLENGTVSFLLVQNVAGAVGDDLDGDDDGVLDTALTVVDGIAVNDGGAGDLTYANVTLNVSYDGLAFAPGGASRIPNGADTDAVADWVRNDFDLAGIPSFTGTPIVGEAINTPGMANAIAEDTAPGTPTDYTIMEIQGASHASGVVGELVRTTGVVTAVAANGFYLQDMAGDGDAATSDGIFVFTGGAPAAGIMVNDSVRVAGTATEFLPGAGGLTITEIVVGSNLVEDLGPSAATPAAAMIGGTGGRLPPAAVIDDDGNTTFDPTTDGLDFYESLEGMLVQVNGAVAVGPTNAFGEIAIVADGGAGAGERSTNGGVVIQPGDFNPERIITDDELVPGEPQVSTGAVATAPIVGVMSYGFGNFKLLNTEPLQFTPSTVMPETTTIAGSEDQLTIASFNVLNLDPADGSQFGELAAIITDNLNRPDIIGLQEIQDNTGETDDGIVSGSMVYQGLIDAIAAAGGPTYAFTEIAPIDNEEGGAPGANIRVGYLYNAARVTLSDTPDRSAGGSTDAVEVLTDADGDPYLSLNVGRIAPNDPAFAEDSATGFEGSRRSLAAEFEFNGEKIFVINNHLKSKSGDGPLFGTTQPPVELTSVQRVEQAKVINDFVDQLLAADPEAKIVVLGDMNDFQFSNALSALKGVPPVALADAELVGGSAEDTIGTAALETGAVLEDLITRLPLSDQYTYIFDGNSQVLDHILVSESLAAGAQFDVVHVNADQPASVQASDHDPVLASVVIPAAETGNYTLQLLHASDLEAGTDAVGRAANFAAIIDKLEDSHANTLILSSGDNFIPSPFFNSGGDPALQETLESAYEEFYGLPAGSVTQAVGAGRADIAIMNIIGFEASAIGNHEFDAGTSVFQSIIARSATSLGAQFPYLSSNLDFSGDPALAGLFTPDILPAGDYAALPGTDPGAGTKKIAPATIIEEGGERIGIVGATTPIVESLSSTGGVQVKDPGAGTTDMALLAQVIQPTIDALVAQGVDKIIVTMHLQQIALEQALAPLLHNVDIIIAGGSNTRLADGEDDLRPGDTADGPYPILTTNADGDPLAIVNTDGEYSYVGRLIVEFDANGILVPGSIDPNESGAFVTTDAKVAELWGTEDPFAEGTKGDIVGEIADAVGDIIVAKDGNIVGTTSVYLEGKRGDVRTEETNLGDLTADANLFVAKQADATVLVSVKNGGGIRDAIGTNVDGVETPPAANPDAGKAEGDVSQLDIENALRFNNALSLVTVTSTQLLEVLEHAVAAVAPGATPGQFGQFGGVAFSYDPGEAAGSRVVSAGLIDDDGNVTQILVRGGELVADAPAAIRLVTLSFLLEGGDSYPFQGFITADPTFADRVDLTDVLTAPGAATFAAAGTEQDALAEYLKAEFATTPFADADTTQADDTRIQNLDFRSDAVLDRVFTGGVDAETITGGAGNDLLAGGDGNDTIDGLGGSDTLYGGIGGDSLLGSDGDDYADGQDGTDMVQGGAGNDTLFGAAGNDTVSGGEGADFVAGNENDDSLNGGTGADIVIGGDGNDTLGGGADADFDVLYGGVGADRFVFSGSSGLYDFVGDFEPGTDILDVTGTGAAGLGDLVFSDYAGQGVKIIGPDASAFFVAGQQQSDVLDSWFDFA